ncbi:hypothetical protein ABB37_02864 [Leptomonas pyrrhocoris]|uniref:Uncharacterized protein n=1 Tax=Leptomonas pyrrhocoris TaxID=157538 RepID=A0A0M9G6C5_LEPPY|nr:hypothetical protein ABB37_02864 [Leptomonas pyrrhocoris]KPA83169.1 hypothetical protein ABB37_02864 [Leptomonas pyrrhocoris]|eukprot:XP_015661608.1 hypothetical protein ABB37_02864 [Leptomonas pyrrhocoris]
MLNEVYAPKTVADLAWSRQKSVALSSFIRSVRGGTHSAAGTQAPRILLLYGPPGSGKLESLKVLLQEEAPTAFTSPPAGRVLAASLSSSSPSSACPSATDSPTSLNILHTCEATVSTYAQYLQHVFSLCSGQLVGSTLELTSSLTDANSEVVDLSGAATGIRSRSSGTPFPASSAPVHHAHIVKFYSEPTSHPLHRCTLLFLRQYEELRSQALREEQRQRQAFGASHQANTLLDHLRRNLIFFVHTTHDSHNDKLDLSTSFPSAVLQSGAVELFHCTPITEINLKKRLKQILDREACRRAARSRARPSCIPEATDADAFFPTGAAAVAGSTGKARPNVGGGAVKRRRGELKTKTALPSKRVPSFTDVLGQGTLDAIAAGSQGDIRQAFLQIQWAALVPPEAAEAEGTVTAAAADRVWARLQKRRALARSTSGYVDGVGATSSPFQFNSHEKEEANHVNGKTGSDDNTVQRDDSAANDGDEEVLFISSSSSSSEPSDTPLSAEGSANEPTSSQGDSRSGNPTPAALKRSRSPQPATTRISSAPRVTDMLSLLDSQMDDVHLPSINTCSERASRKMKKESHHASKRSRNSTPIGDASAATSTKPEHRSVLPTTRDEYLGLSHATARLLTQKYSVDEVLDVLNVPPRKMLDYLTNNQVRYFGDGQLPQYAACAATASDADALRTSEFGGSGASAAALRERRQLADRTTAGENVGSTSRLLDVIALHLFYQTYLTEQTELHAPHGFAAQEPPPFLRSAYPRIRDVVSFLSSAAASTPGSNTSAFGDRFLPLDVVGFSEQEWVQRFLIRLDSASDARSVASPLSALNTRRRGVGTTTVNGSKSRAVSASSPRLQLDEVDIVREGLPGLLHRCGCTEAVVVDYYALAPYIVLSLPPPETCAVDPPHSAAPPPSPAPSSTSIKAHAEKVDAKIDWMGKREAPPPFSTTSTTSAAATAFCSPGPRRTVFKFAAKSAASDSLSTNCESTAALTPHKHRRSFCTLLQLRILQRGRDRATATLRDDHFSLVDEEITSSEGVMGDDGGAEERLWIPEGEDIEDD